MKLRGLSLLLLGLMLVSCGPSEMSSSSSSGSSSSGASSSSSSTTPSSGSSTTSSGEDPSGEIVAFGGIVRIYYHNDANDYINKRLWIWATDVDGNILGETRFDNQDSPDDYGVYKDIDMSAEPFAGTEYSSISFIVKDAGTWAGQSKDILLNFGDFISNKTTTESGQEMITCYAVQGNGQEVETYVSKEDAMGDRLEFAYLSSWNSIVAIGTGTKGEREEEDVGKVSHYSLYAYGSEYYQALDDNKTPDMSEYLIKEGIPDSKEFTISLDEDADPSLNYVIEATFAQNPDKTRSKSVSFSGLYDTEKFQEELVYEGDDLGYSEVDGNAVFKLWAPTASRVQLFLYLTGRTPEINLTGHIDPTLSNHRTMEMTRGEKGVWTYSVPLDEIIHEYYTFSVTNASGTNEAIDPYAKAASINGIRAYRITDEDFNALKPEGFDAAIQGLETTYGIDTPNELSVYEAHIRDLTMDDTWNGKEIPGTFKAFHEKGTTYTGTTESGETITVKTGFDHIVETGVNAVQLLPVFDQDNDERFTTDEEGNVTAWPSYNWGYNPQNYNVVEGAYSSDPWEPEVRINEYMGLVQAFAEEGIRIIMDVVYNHVSSVTNFSYNKIVPDYFMRKDANGNYHDGSGTGNVTASERPFVRKFIVDSVSFWASTYGIKGFRFDLMGCHDTITMRAVKDALHDIDPQIVVYGEGWTGYSGSGLTEGYLEANQQNVYKELYDQGKGSVGCFNGGGRDGLKGETQWESNLPAYGFMSQGEEHIQYSTVNEAALQFIGTNSRGGSNPIQTLNYVACHDNYTLYDQMNFCFGDGTASGVSIQDREEAIKATMALNASMMMSQGMAFLNGGDEFFRQKYLTPEDPFYDLCIVEATSTQAIDGFVMGDGNIMVRNSYTYGDECNSFKWDRKAKYYEEYSTTIESIRLRNELLEAGVLGLTMGDEYYVDATLWGELTSADAWNAATAAGTLDKTAIAINLNVSENYYVMLGGRSSNQYSDLPCGNDTYKVVYSSSFDHTAGTTFTVSDNTMGVAQYELLVLQKA